MVGSKKELLEELREVFDSLCGAKDLEEVDDVISELDNIIDKHSEEEETPPLKYWPTVERRLEYYGEDAPECKIFGHSVDMTPKEAKNHKGEIRCADCGIVLREAPIRHNCAVCNKLILEDEVKYQGYTYHLKCFLE